ncbi:hypothetical protein MMC28_011576 [Mycoblastus sanguinarius]|nr:hypothetical protein [Mycoblastus sanguinarius]
MASVASSNASKYVASQQDMELEDQHPSTITEKLASQELPPLNGGLLAWMQVAASFCIFFSTWGIVNMYGVYQTYYSSNLPSSPSAISWIGSIQAFLLFLVGTLVGPIYDSGYVRSLLFIGSFLSVFGLFMTSICQEYWQFLLSQGVVTGAGFGCLFLPGVTVVSQYFSTKKAFATGIASLGSSIGGVIYPIAFTQLQPRIGASWATRVIAFILMLTLILPLVVIRPRNYSAKRRSLLDLSALRDVPYVLFGCGILLGYMGIYVVFVYVQLYAVATAGVPSELAFYILAIINAGSSLGRVLPNFAADHIGTLNMQVLFVSAAAVLSLSLLAIHATSGILAFCVLYGFFTGTFVSLPGPTVASMTSNLTFLGGRMSMAFMAAGTGLLVGTPVAGAILATGGGNNWTMLQIWSGTLLVLSAVCMLGARVAKVGWGLLKKA